MTCEWLESITHFDWSRFPSYLWEPFWRKRLTLEK